MTENIVLSKWKCFVREYFLILWVSEQLFSTFSFGTFSFHFSNVQIFHSCTVKMFLWYIILQCFFTMKYIWMVAKKNILVTLLQCFPINTFKTFHYIKWLKRCIFWYGLRQKQWNLRIYQHNQKMFQIVIQMKQ